jgi:hypothetical protein
MKKVYIRNLWLCDTNCNSVSYNNDNNKEKDDDITTKSSQVERVRSRVRTFQRQEPICYNLLAALVRADHQQYGRGRCRLPVECVHYRID